MADETQDDPVQVYSALLEQLATSPYQRDLHLQRIQLAKDLGLEDEVEQARQGLIGVFPLSEAEWEEWIDDRKAKLPQAGAIEDVAPFLELVELYRRAQQDYLSIPLLSSFSRWSISSYYAASGLTPPAAVVASEEEEDEAMQPSAEERKVGEPDQLLQVVFSLEEVKEIREEVLSRGGGHLSESSSLWNIWRDFEMDLLKLDNTPDQLAALSSLYLARLAVPHLSISETFSAYSSFITKFDNATYDEALPAANKVFSAANKKVEERFEEEDKLSKSSFSSEAYMTYVSWEREVKRPDIFLVKNLLERAIHDHPSVIELWETWLEFLYKIPEKESNLLEVAEKAVRNIPNSAQLWTAAMRAYEKRSTATSPATESVESLFQRALSTGEFEKDMDAVVELYTARAGFYRREMERKEKDAAEEEGPDAELVGFVLGVLQEGIERTKQVHKKGDPQNRLEKYLIKIYERFGMADEARQAWETLTKERATSYAVWYGWADFETRMGNYNSAHETYVAGCSTKGLDYPEYLLDAWMTFEHEYGNLADLEFTIVKIRRQRKGLERRRAREAAEAASAYASSAAAAPAGQDSFISSAVAQPATSTFAMDVESTDVVGGRKREREDGAEDGRGKKVRIDSPAAQIGEGEVKRDREHSTVFAISPGEMSEEDIRKLFRDCGEIRSLKVKSLAGQTFAQIEFAEKDSVLAAQTKDKKRIQDHELEVYVAWKSCLYVTNFPEDWDKEKVEILFGKYGTIFDTRWPSKRFKNTRRFCYVQFANPAHAEAALALYGTELVPSQPLSVLISDPSRKKSRTDNNANDRELYVAGLARSTKESDLRKLFEPFGMVKGIRVPTEDGGGCKGFAFVEYEDQLSAQSALSLNNHEFKKRHISVTIAQARAAGTAKAPAALPKKSETENRGIRVRGLAPGTDEAVIQQTFEKIASVERVNYEVGDTEAVVLLQNAADVGKLLMHRSSFTIDGTPVEILTEGRQARTAGGKKPPAATGGAAKDVPLMPRQASRGRGRVGLAGGRGGRGGRMGLGAGRAAQSAAAVPKEGETGAKAVQSGEAPTAAERASGKSVDDFRAMLMKK
ncbi:hypothetical protein JCM11641_001820 [Rhodosporidiobolus odoratus]